MLHTQPWLDSIYFKNSHTAKFSQLSELPTNPSRKMLTRTMTCRQIFDNLSQRLHLHYQHRTSSIKHTTKASPRIIIQVPHAFYKRKDLIDTTCNTWMKLQSARVSLHRVDFTSKHCSVSTSIAASIRLHRCFRGS